MSPARVHLFSPSEDPVERNALARFGRHLAGEVPRMPREACADDAELEAHAAVAQSLEAEVDAFAADRAAGLVVRERELDPLLELVETAVNEDAVLGGAGAVGPEAAEVQPERAAGRGVAPRCGRPAP